MEHRHPRSQFAHVDLISFFISFLWASILFFTCSLNWAEAPTLETDAALRNLLISVKNNNEGNESAQQQSISGGIKRDKVYIGTGGPVQPAQDGITIRHEGLAYNTVNTRRTFSSLSEQNIRTVEGYPAFLYTGQSIKYPSQNSEGNPYTVEADALQGFYVTARLAGERVVLTISTRNDHLDPNKDQNDELVINTQQLSTTVSGRIGEWIDLGGITLSDDNHDTSLVKKTTARSASVGNIAVKITALD